VAAYDNDDADAGSVGSAQSGGSSGRHVRPRASGGGGGGNLPKRPSGALQLQKTKVSQLN
jgi:hypothetical protein